MFNNEDEIEIRVLGITYNQIESGVYAVLLEEVGGHRRLPIIIGYPEAQSIECRLQGVMTPRPLSHDLMASIIRTLGATLSSIHIRKLPNGVFRAFVELKGGDGNVYLVDARSSDAIALSLRFGCPIFTTPGVLAESGYTPERDTPVDAASGVSAQAERDSDGFESMSLSRLMSELDKAVDNEQYEIAAKIKTIIDRKKSE